jgi:hypothetical protein
MIMSDCFVYLLHDASEVPEQKNDWTRSGLREEARKLSAKLSDSADIYAAY